MDELLADHGVTGSDAGHLHRLAGDWQLLADSLARTRRLVVYDDSNRSCGFAAEVLATAAEEMPLAAPPKRVTRADVPISCAGPG